MAEESSKLTTAKTILSTVASVAATAVVVRSVIRKYIPHELQYFLWLRLFRFLSRFDNELTLVIDEYAGLVRNEIYSAAKCYLVPKISPDTRRLSIIKNRKEKNIEIYMEKDEMILDVYNGEKLKWAFVVKATGLAKTASDSFSQRLEARSFELSFHKRNMDMVINSYLPHIIREANLTEQQKKTLKIHTVNYDYFYGRGYAWNSVNLDHPATFDTLAMDTDQKDAIMKDLEMFVERRDYYRRVGKAWKRGYLLYGPAGTGKSSLIAAIANFLNFDIYDLELTDVKSNSNLRKVLLETANKSILVVEDIDCTIDLQNRKRMLRDLSDMDCDLTTPVNRDQNKVTLSGLLNFTDGLWSSCGDERIIIFTTNHKENLEPALLRPGRMDVHIHMSYCTPSGFKILANNYLGLKDHPLFKDIEDLLRTMNVTPADVAEQLLKQNQNNGPEASLHGLLEFLHEMKRKRAEEEEEEALQQKKKIDDDDKKVTSTEDDEFCSD